jgi:hypothetical protein
MSKSKLIAVAALAITGALGTGLAQARDADVRWSVTIGSPGYTQVPVYTQPYPVYSRPAPVLVQPGPIYRYIDYRQPSRWDRDGDGIPNRHDRLYNPRWDVDGDGVPNARDRHNHRRHDRDGDGVPNRYDRDDDRGHNDRDHGDGWRGR